MSMFEVGQEVTYYTGSRRQGGGQRAVVTRIGRKYAYIELHRREYGGFDLKTGHGPNPYGSGDYIETDESRATKERRAVAMERTKRLRDAYGGVWERELTVEQIERIADIIEEQQ